MFLAMATFMPRCNFSFDIFSLYLNKDVLWPRCVRDQCFDTRQFVMTRFKRTFRRRGFLTGKKKSKILLSLVLGIVFGFLFSYISGKYFLVSSKAKLGCRRRAEVQFTPEPRPERGPRPGNLSTELTASKGFILLGIMTADHLLATRAKTIHTTWGSKIDSGKVLFFSGETRNISVNFTVINLPGVDDSYPPQRKSFHMLKYIYDQYIDDFHWFVRADDDVYVRSERLSALLRTMNSSEDVLIGQAGVGKSHEMGKLGLQEGDNFCIGGPGIVMSRSVLRKVAPFLSTCLNETVSSHEDVELGRCIRKHVGVICPWALKARHLFYQIFGDPEVVFSDSLAKKPFTRAISVHPVKNSTNMFRLHVKFLTTSVQLSQHRSNTLQQRLHRIRALLRDNENRTTGFQKAEFYGRLSRNSSTPWENFNMQYLYGLSESPVSWISGRTLQALTKVLGEVVSDVNNEAAKTLQEPEELKKFHLGSMRIHPTLGLQFTLDLKTLGKMQKPRQLPRHIRHYGHFQQSFAPLLTTTVEFNNNFPTVHFIVPLVKRFDAFVRFLNSFEKAFLTQRKLVSLLIVYFPDVASPGHHKKLFEDFCAKHPKVDLRWSELVGEFSRARALELGTKSYGDDALLFFADVDLIFTTEFYQRCQTNTLRGQRVYFPIMFSQFNPNVVYHNQSKPPDESRVLTKRAGAWRRYSYGPVCVYANDVSAVGGLNTTIRGWGLEDLDFYEKCLSYKLDVFRAPDKGLVHLYHPQTSCFDPRMNALQARMCEDSRLQGIASAESLVEYILSKAYIET